MVGSSAETLSRAAVHRCQDDEGLVAVATDAAADPELAVEPEMPRLDSIIAADVLHGLRKKERKRQDVINGNECYVYRLASPVWFPGL